MIYVLQNTRFIKLFIWQSSLRLSCQEVFTPTINRIILTLTISVFIERTTRLIIHHSISMSICVKFQQMLKKLQLIGLRSLQVASLPLALHQILEIYFVAYRLMVGLLPLSSWYICELSAQKRSWLSTWIIQSGFATSWSSSILIHFIS